MIKKYIVVFVFLLSACQHPKPMLMLSSDLYDFKEIAKNKHYRGSSVIKNTGDDTLKIFQIEAGCSCTQAYTTKNILLPNDTCKLNFTYNTQNKQGLEEFYICIYANTDSLVHLLKIRAFIN